MVSRGKNADVMIALSVAERKIELARCTELTRNSRGLVASCVAWHSFHDWNYTGNLRHNA